MRAPLRPDSDPEGGSRLGLRVFGLLWQGSRLTVSCSKDRGPACLQGLAAGVLDPTLCTLVLRWAFCWLHCTAGLAQGAPLFPWSSTLGSFEHSAACRACAISTLWVALWLVCHGPA